MLRSVCFSHWEGILSVQVSRGAASGTVPGAFRVMVVDDSAIIRGFLSRYLNEDPEIEVIITANNGVVALRNLEKYDVEVVVLDIEMPEMDGMTALPKIIDQKPEIQVVMASTLTRKNAEVSLRALQMGAVDYVPKPETARSVNASIDFRRELVDKVKAWATRARNKKNIPLPASPKKSDILGAVSDRSAGFVSARRPSAPASDNTGFVRPGARPVTQTAALTGLASRVRSNIGSNPRQQSQATPARALTGLYANSKVEIRKASNVIPKILAVGSSTGGPQALMKFFKGFDKQPKVPVVITQHMPAQFTTILANHLGQNTGWPSAEAKEGMELLAGNIYVAPGGKHLEIIASHGKYVCHLSDTAPENFCKPAVDPMLRSLEALFKDKVLVVILTGMGHDGLKGSRDLARLGANIMAQDEASSVVWGMPGAVATAGLCTDILSIEDIGLAASRRLEGGR